MSQFILILMVHVVVMGGESETFTKHWHAYDNQRQCEIAAENLTATLESGNETDFIAVDSKAVCERFDPKKHGNLYRGVK